MSATLQVERLTVRYDDAPALSDVTLDFAPGQVVGLIGPNGAGKSTLLKACVGLVNVDRGRILLDAQPLAAWSPVRRARLIGYLPQSRVVAWPVSVARLVALGRLPHLSSWQAPSDVDRAVIDNALRETDTMTLADRPVTSLSGGELARVLVARLLAGTPEILLADEPIAGLDPAHTLQVMEVFRGVARAGRTVVVVLHDLNTAARFCDRLVMLDVGRVVADGPPAQVLTEAILARHYHISAAILPYRGETLVIPWSR